MTFERNECHAAQNASANKENEIHDSIEERILPEFVWIFVGGIGIR